MSGVRSLRHHCRAFFSAMLLLGPALIALGASSAPALAAPGSRAEADRLFREGKKLYDEGKYKEACEALAASDALDPAIGTLGLLAACHEKQGRLLDAWKEYLETKDRAESKRDQRAEYAGERAQAVKARLARLAIETRDDATKMEITRDGESIPPSVVGVLVPVDPGEHVVVARDSNKKEWKTTVNLKEGESNTVIVPSFAELAAQGGPPRWLAYALGGVGIAGIAAGSVAGAIAISKNSDSNDAAVCKPTARLCPSRDSAMTAATVSTISFIGGGALLAAGTVLFFLSSPAPSQAEAGASASLGSVRIFPSVGPSGIFVGAAGSF